MEQRRIKFMYHIDQIGECYLTEDDDIPALFLMTRRYAMEQIEVQIHLNDGSGILMQELHDNHTVLHSGGTSHSNHSADEGGSENTNPLIKGPVGKARLSVVWSNLIVMMDSRSPVTRTSSENRLLSSQQR